MEIRVNLFLPKGRSCRFALAAALCTTVAFGGSIIYGVGPGGGSPYALYRVSSVTGGGTLVGPTFGWIGLSAMDAAPDGTLFVSGQDFFLTRELLTLNPATGVATLVTPVTGLPANVGANDFAFRLDGTLFAVYGASSLYTLNTVTGAATFVGSPVTAASPETLAFTGNTLYLSDGISLYTVNQSTGTVSLLTTLSFDANFGLSGRPEMYMKFDPTNGTLYTSVFENGSSSLGTINIATGEVIRVGATVLGLGPLAIEATPEPSSWLLISLGFLALAFLRLQRS